MIFDLTAPYSPIVEKGESLKIKVVSPYDALEKPHVLELGKAVMTFLNYLHETKQVAASVLKNLGEFYISQDMRHVIVTYKGSIIVSVELKTLGFRIGRGRLIRLAT